MDNELYKLCKEVYEKAGWKPAYRETQWLIQNEAKEWSFIVYEAIHQPSCPLYTSDYLLEKLPRRIKDTFLTVSLSGNIELWAVGYWNDSLSKLKSKNYADTPLKALLKLTLALHKAGEL